MNRLFTYLFITILLFSACKKHIQNNANQDTQGYADSQVVGTWKITAVVSDVLWDWDGNGIPEKNIYNTWTACQKENLYNFIGDFTATFKLTCSVSEPGTWKIIDTKYLEYATISVGLESEKFISMTNVEFKTTKDYTLSNGQPATITKTWSRQ